MNDVQNHHYTAVLAENMFLKQKQKAREDEEQARDASKRPQEGTTVAHLGIHRFSTPAVLREAQRRTAATKSKGKDIAVDLLVQLGSPLDGESSS